MTKLHHLYRRPHEQKTPRSRDEIEGMLAQTLGVAPASVNTSLTVADMHRSMNQQNALILEALLDIRDLLVQQVSLLDLTEHNTQSAAVVFESQIDKHHRADPPIAELHKLEGEDAVDDANEFVDRGWRILGSSVDPHGFTHILLGRPVPREERV